MKEELQYIQIGLKQLEGEVLLENWEKVMGLLEDLEGFVQDMKDTVEDIITAEEEEEEQDE